MAESGHASRTRRTGGILPCVLYLLLGLVIAGIFFWRVATTDPSWKAAPAPVAAAKPPVVQKTEVRDEPVKEAVVELPARPEKKPVEKRPARKIPTHAEVNEYFAVKLGERIPLLRGGATREATLTAFTDDEFVVRIGAGDTTTISRATLSEDQLALWKN